MPNHVNIRSAQLKDAERLIEFNLRLADETEGKQLDRDILTRGVQTILKDASRGFYLVAELERSVIGCLMITTEWSDWRNGDFWWIQSVYVSPECRGQGIFRALYEHARRQAERSDRVCGCRLYVERENTPAQATYRSLGFSETRYNMLEDLF